jgi:hypothetical protein
MTLMSITPVGSWFWVKAPIYLFKFGKLWYTAGIDSFFAFDFNGISGSFEKSKFDYDLALGLLIMSLYYFLVDELNNVFLLLISPNLELLSKF